MLWKLITPLKIQRVASLSVKIVGKRKHIAINTMQDMQELEKLVHHALVHGKTRIFGKIPNLRQE